MSVTQSFTKVGQFFQDGDVIGAINELINIPAYATNASLNGAGNLDLTGIANSIGALPPQITAVGLNMGGLLSPGLPTADPDVQSGGVMFDAVSAVVSQKVSNLPPPNGTYVTVTDPGRPVGLVGSVVGLGQILGTEMTVVPPPVPTAAVAPAAALEAAAPAAAVEAAAPVAAAVEAAAPEAPAAQAVSADDQSAPAPTAKRGRSHDGNGGGRHRRAD